MTITEFLNENTFTELTEDVLAECEHFSCGVDDLDEYFQKDVLGKRQITHGEPQSPKVIIAES
jgi:hypothetical protein